MARYAEDIGCRKLNLTKLS